MKKIEVQDVTDADIGFGGNVAKLMPDYGSIPEEYKHGSGKWNKLFDDMFFNGITLVHIQPKDGIDGKKALRHIRAIAASWEPKHEHKEAACAYLFSQWFDDIEYKCNR